MWTIGEKDTVLGYRGATAAVEPASRRPEPQPLSATVSERVPQWFSRALGSNLTVSARSTSGYFLPSVGGCIYALEP